MTHIARTTPIPGAIGHLARLRRDSDVSVALEATHAIRSLVESSPMLRSEQREALVDTLAASLQAADAESRRELAALLERVAPDAPTALARFQTSADDADQMALRSAIRAAGDDGAALRAVRWLAWPVAAPTAADALKGRFDGSVLLAAHLLMNPRRRAFVARRRTQSSPLPSPECLANVDIDRLPHAFRWRLAVNSERKHRAVDVRVAMSTPGVAHRILCAHNLDPRAIDDNKALAEIAFDADPRVSNVAAVRMDRTSPATMSTWESLSRTANPENRRRAAIAGRERVRLQIRDLRQRANDEPDFLLAEIRGAMHAGNATRRMQAIALLRRLRLERLLVDELLRALQDPDHRVVATAVRAMARVESTSSKTALATCLAHEDARVRANALEALAANNPATAPIESAAFDDVARIRGNAVRGLLRRRDGADGVDRLEAMLGDDRPAHRLSGLWVAERLTPVDVAETVARLANSEIDPVVRRRAKRCARRLLAEMRNGRTPVDVGAGVAAAAAV